MARFLSVEIESDQLRAAEVDITASSEKVRCCFCVPLPRGAVEDGQIRDTKGVGELLKAELAEHKVRTKKAVFVSGSSRIASREIRVPVIKKNKIQSMLEANASDYFPIDISQYVLSYSIIDTETAKQDGGEELKQYHMMVYAAPKAISIAYREMAEAAGLRIVSITYTGDSIYQAIRREYADGLHILVKIEMNNTALMIIHNGELAMQRTVNYGIDGAIEAVRELPQFGDDLDDQQALGLLENRLCINDSLDGVTAMPGDEHYELQSAKAEVTESFRYMIGNISRIMDYYISRNNQAVFDSIICCGPGAEIKGLDRLLTNELNQGISILRELKSCTMPDDVDGYGLSFYTAVVAAKRSQLNFLDKVTRKKKETKDTLSGAIVICALGVIAGLALTVTGIGNRMYQQKNLERLNQRIDEESSIQEVYDTYNATKAQYDSYTSMYDKTNTPNENLKAFLEEMEQKMPSDMTLDNFTSTGTEVTFSLRTTGKTEAANVLLQLRTFESLSTVTTTGLDEDENGTVSMSVTCSYKNPAAMDLEEQQ